MKAVFLDRDGTITCDLPGGYPHLKEHLKFEEGAIEGLQKLQAMGFLLIITTGQSGIGRGYYTEEDYQNYTRLMLENLGIKGIRIDAVYHCPHHPEKGLGSYLQNCACRKPGTGMINQALADFKARGIAIDLDGSFVIGDKTDDGLMGNHAGCVSILVRCPTGKKGLDGHYACQWAQEVDNLKFAANWIESATSINK